MNTKQYQKISDPYRRQPRRLTLLIYLNRGITLLTFLSYPVLLYRVYRVSYRAAFSYLIFSGAAFMILSLIRKRINRPRPYEALSITPLIPRDKSGVSFPSRHIFCIYLIAGMWLPIQLPIGCLFLICGLILAYIRVVGGIHYLSDVICGAITGVLAALIIIHFSL